MPLEAGYPNLQCAASVCAICFLDRLYLLANSQDTRH